MICLHIQAIANQSQFLKEDKNEKKNINVF